MRNIVVSGVIFSLLVMILDFFVPAFVLFVPLCPCACYYRARLLYFVHLRVRVCACVFHCAVYCVRACMRAPAVPPPHSAWSPAVAASAAASSAAAFTAIAVAPSLPCVFLCRRRCRLCRRRCRCLLAAAAAAAAVAFALYFCGAGRVGTEGQGEREGVCASLDVRVLVESLLGDSLLSLRLSFSPIIFYFDGIEYTPKDCGDLDRSSSTPLRIQSLLSPPSPIHHHYNSHQPQP